MTLKTSLQLVDRTLQGFADAVFPMLCALCGAPGVGGVFCQEHRLRGPAPGAHCARCAGLLPTAVADGNLCSACRLDPPGWTRLVALTDYGFDPAARAWILALKHGGRRDLARPLGEFLAQRISRSQENARLELSDSTLVVPVPLHFSRRIVRGYDQAQLLARVVAIELGLATWNLLRRTRATTPQGAPGSRSRAANVRGAFESIGGARGRLSGRPVLLVDDVVTSGATASECGRRLRSAGAGKVTVACLARASPRRIERAEGSPDP